MEFRKEREEVWSHGRRNSTVANGTREDLKNTRSIIHIIKEKLVRRNKMKENNTKNCRKFIDMLSF